MTKKQIAILLGLLIIGGAFTYKGLSKTDAPSPQKQAHAHYTTEPIRLHRNDVYNQSINLSDYAGKVVIIDFWATWCPPCVAEIPHFVELQKEYGDTLQIIGVSMENNISEIKTFIDRKGINYPIVINTPTIQAQFGDINSIPTTFILDKEHRIVTRAIGFRDKGFFEKAIQPLF